LDLKNNPSQQKKIISSPFLKRKKQRRAHTSNLMGWLKAHLN